MQNITVGIRMAYLVDVIGNIKTLFEFFGFMMTWCGFLFGIIMLTGETKAEVRLGKNSCLIGFVGIAILLMSFFIPSRDILYDIIISK